MNFLPRAILVAGIGLIAVLQPVPAPAQQAQQQQQQQGAEGDGVAVRIAVIDVDAIRRNAKAVQNIKSQVDKYRSAFGSDAQKEDEELRAANEQLARQRAILSPDVFAEERRKFEQRVAAFQRKVQQRKEALDRVVSEAMKIVQEELNEVIIEIAKEYGLTLILQKEATILVATPLEATGEALKRLDARLSTVKVTDPNTLASQSGN